MPTKFEVMLYRYSNEQTNIIILFASQYNKQATMGQNHEGSV